MKKMTNMAKAKNQMIFLNRCIHHKLLPRFLRVHCPINSSRGNNITERYRNDLLVATRNDARSRLFTNSHEKNRILEALLVILSQENADTLKRITDSTYNTIFTTCRDKLKNKFELLFLEKYRIQFTKNPTSTANVVKDCVLNIHDAEIPANQAELLNLGPKFAVTPSSIPYMDIITTTEIEALRLEKEEEPAKAALLRRDVQRILKNAKPPTSNLSHSHRQAIKEIKSEENVVIYQYDKGNGFVRMAKDTAHTKMIEGIGQTTILDNDPTKTHLGKIQNALKAIRKKVDIPAKLYHQIYPSDATPPRAYGQCKAHKPTRQYPFRRLVSTIGTAPYALSEYLVKII